MHVAADLNWFLEFVVFVFAGAFGLLYLVRNIASRYFVVDSNFNSSATDYSSLDRRKSGNMGESGGGAGESLNCCAVCGLLTKKQCARCKMVKYCSEACQKSHWNSEHKTKCKDLQSFYKANLTKPKSALSSRKASLVPSADKEHVWNHVIKEKFVVNNGMNKKYIISSLGKKWKDYRGDLYNAYYDPTADWETNVQNHPEDVPRDHWAGYLSYRMRQSTKDMCERNIENRRKQKVPHTLGSKTIARKKHEMEAELGRSCSRAEMWNIAHKKKNGSFVNDEAKKKSEELDMHTPNSSETKAFTKVFGKEHPGRVRSVGHCVAPSQFFGSTSYLGEETSSQANVEIQGLKSEVKALRAQMAYFMEHFGAQMLDGNPNNNQAVDASSPALVRRSSSGGHDPRSLGSHNRGRSSHV